MLGLSIHRGFTQNKVAGKFIDQAHHPIEYLAVTVSIEDSALTGTLTDTSGAFTLNLPDGNYRLKASLFGKSLYQRDISLTQSIDLGTIQVNTDVQMKEVTINAQKKLIERKADRLVFHVDRSIAATGGTAIDALKATPSLRVRDESIQLIDGRGLSIMINGRISRLSGPALAHFLQSIPSADIQSIEVISEPPARYEAEGSGGLVDIKLKTLGPDNWNASLHSSYRQATYPTGSASGSFNCKKNKLSLYSNISHNNGSERGTDDETIQYSRQTWDSDYRERDYTRSLSGRLGLDYKFSKKWTMGMDYTGSFDRPHTDRTGHTAISNNRTLVVDSLIDTKSGDRSKDHSNGLNLHAVAQLDTLGSTLNADLDYFGYSRSLDRNSETQSQYGDATPMPKGYSAYNDARTRNFDMYSAKVDVNTPLKWIQLSYGGKLYFSQSDYDNAYSNNTRGTFVKDEKRSDAFEYMENVQALYLSGKGAIKEHWKFKFGLRMENTQTRGTSITQAERHKNSYTEFFPSAYLLYELNDDHNFRLYYGRRISRPSFHKLNPFKLFLTPYRYSQGNPSLRPSFIHNIKFEYDFQDVLFTSLAYGHRAQGSGNPPVFDERSGISHLRYLNYFQTDMYGFNAFYIFDRISGLESECEVNVYYTQNRVTRPQLKLEGVQSWGAYFSLDNSVILNPSKTIKGEINFWYDTPQLDGMYKKKARGSLDLGLRFSALKQHLNLSLFAWDILKTKPYKEKLRSEGTRYRFVEYGDSRAFRISLSYRFGSRDLKVKRREAGNKTERRRAM